MKLLGLLGLLTVLLIGCASHTQVGGNRFGATFEWGSSGQYESDPYSYQDTGMRRY